MLGTLATVVNLLPVVVSVVGALVSSDQDGTPQGQVNEDAAVERVGTVIKVVDDALIGDRLSDAQEVALRTMIQGLVAFIRVSRAGI